MGKKKRSFDRSAESKITRILPLIIGKIVQSARPRLDLSPGELYIPSIRPYRYLKTCNQLIAGASSSRYRANQRRLKNLARHARIETYAHGTGQGAKMKSASGHDDHGEDRYSRVDFNCGSRGNDYRSPLSSFRSNNN